jgi:hypothetical protein
MITEEEAYLNHMADIGEEYLEHFGVKGMQWGVRRRLRIARTAAVGKTTGNRGNFLDKTRVHYKANPIDLVRTFSWKKSAARKSARMIRRNNALVSSGKGKVRSFIPFMYSTRVSDILPSVGSKRIADMNKKIGKQKVKRPKNNNRREIGLLGAVVAAGVLMQAGSIPASQLLASGIEALDDATKY